MLKTLKFVAPLPELILAGKKTSTWRLNDEKNIIVNDELSLCNTAGKEFARAKVIEVLFSKLGNLDSQEKAGHESYASEQEMYDTFSKFYNFPVGPATEVKIIKFKLL
jgi:hypothetical protein